MINKTNYQFFLGIDVSKHTLDYATLQGTQLLSQGKVANTTKEFSRALKIRNAMPSVDSVL